MERRLLVAAVAMLALTSCGQADEPASGVPMPTADPSVEQADTGMLGSWRFESLEVDGVPFPIDQPLFMDITEDGFRASTTCNWVSGNFGGEIVTTLMGCGDDAANAGERHMSQALRAEPVQSGDQLVFDDGNVRLVYRSFTEPLPGDLFAVLADQTLDVDESVLPSQEVTGTVPPDFDTLVPLPSPTSEVDLFLAVINGHVCVVYGTDTALDKWCQEPRFAAESTNAVNIPLYAPMFRIALIPDRFGPGVASRPDLGTYTNNLLVVGDDAPTGSHVITDATGATFKLTISTELTTATATSQPTATTGMPTPDTTGSQAESSEAPSSSTVPASALSELDLQQIFAAAAASRAAGFVAAENHTDLRIDVIDTIGRPQGDNDPMLRFPEDAQFSESQRAAIVAALAPLSVVFVPPTVFEDQNYVTYDGLAGNVVLSIGEPIKEEGEFRITTGLLCGLVCGYGGAQQLEQLEDGTWALTNPVGPQWVA